MIDMIKTFFGLAGLIVGGTTLWGMITDRTLSGWGVLVICGICVANLFSKDHNY